MSTRDDFTKKTVDVLARRAGGRCSICGSATYGPNDNPYTSTNIGQAAHIAAAAEGGPRYDPAMSSDVRKSLKNGIWLCSNCHDKVDRNPETYSVQELHQLKKAAETSARDNLGIPQLQTSTATTSAANQDDSPLLSTISSIAIVEIRKVRAELAAQHGSKLSQSQAWEFLSKIDFIDFSRDDYLPQVGNEVLKLLFRLVGHKLGSEFNLEIIRHIKDIADKFVHTWGQTEAQETCQLTRALMKDQRTNSTVHQSSLALLKDITKTVKKLKNKEATKIFDDCYNEVIRKKIRTLSSAVEDTDNPGSEEDEKGVPAAKRRRGLGQEDNNMLQYLDSMLHLGGATVREQEEHIEQRIADMGFESNIL